MRLLTAVFGIFLVVHGLVHLLYVAQARRLVELSSGLTWPDGSWVSRSRHRRRWRPVTHPGRHPRHNRALADAARSIREYVGRMPLFESDKARRVALATAWVVPEPIRCVQCGVCSFRCPVEIDVRHYVWLGEPVRDSHCLTCGQCVDNCPRGLLRLEPVDASVHKPSDPRPA